MAEQKLKDRIDRALEADIPQIYFNTSIHSINANDVTIILERNQQPVAILNTSWGQAKALVGKLNELLQGFERASGVPITTADEIVATVTRKQKKTTKRKATKKSGKIKIKSTIH